MTEEIYDKYDDPFIGLNPKELVEKLVELCNDQETRFHKATFEGFLRIENPFHLHCSHAFA